MTDLLQRPSRVLIVDDTPDMRLILTLLFQRYEGVEVCGEAGDGQEAIEQAHALQPDVILLDLAMPRLSGLDALESLARVAPDSKIVVLSGFDADRLGSRALESGADAYIQKGVPPEVLVEVVSDVLHRPLTRTTAPARRTVIPTADAHAATSPTTGLLGDDPTKVIARVAHELRNPAVALGLRSEELAHAELCDDCRPLSALIEGVARQATLIDRLTTDLMTSAHARKRLLSINPRHFTLRETLLDAVAGVPDAIETVEINCDPDLGVFADRVRLHQLVTNLVTNALKYGRPPVHIVAADNGAAVCLQVQDAGDGVPEWFRERLFDEYARADDSGASGTGIGLYIVRALAEAHGGRAWYEPSPLGGAGFAVTFPHAT